MMIAQCPMDLASPTPLLGGLSPHDFMRRHWQKRPLMIRAAAPDAGKLVDRATLFRLAARDDVESRLVVRDGERWSVRQGPIARRALPAATAAPWTLLVQGVDLHLDAAHRLLGRFRFVPDARLDDLMVSYATDGGGVGPHVDSYDVFLLQLHGRRRWRVGRVGRKPALRPDAPLKILAGFEADRRVAARTRRHAVPAAGLGPRRRRRGRGDHRVDRLSGVRRRAAGARRRAAPARRLRAARARGALRRPRPGRDGRARPDSRRAARLRASRGEPPPCRSGCAGPCPRRGAERAEARRLVRSGRRAGAGGDAAPRPAHPDALRRASCLRQRRRLQDGRSRRHA